MGDRREAAGRGARATRAGGGDRARSGAPAVTPLRRRPLVAQTFRPASGRRGSPKGLRYVSTAMQTLRSRFWMFAVAGIAIAALVAAAARRSSAAEPLFVESAAATGLVFTHVNGATGKYYLPEMMGAGVALFDFDNDGDLDVFLVQSGAIDARGDASAAC